MLLIHIKETRTLGSYEGTRMKNLPSTVRGERGKDSMKLAKKGFTPAKTGSTSTGFTLIELLVVIAIIGILAAIILPVYAQAKKSAYKSADMGNMNQLRTALGLYRVDQGGYPPALLGYVTQYAGGENPTTTDVLPANQVQGALFPKRVDSLAIFQPALDRPAGSPVNNLFTNPVWPNGLVGQIDPTPPALTSNGQAFGPATTVKHCDLDGNQVPSYYYLISGYDVANVQISGGATQNEIHYSPFWSWHTVPDGCTASDLTAAQGSTSDNPRQLGYSDPPESTVVTWNGFFRDYDNGVAQHQKQDIVLFLEGDARPYDSANVAAQAFQVTP